MLISELAKQLGAGEGPFGSVRPRRAGCGGGGPGGQPEGSGRGRRARSAAEAEARQCSGLGRGPDGAVGWEMRRDGSGEAAAGTPLRGLRRPWWSGRVVRGGGGPVLSCAFARGCSGCGADRLLPRLLPLPRRLGHV